MSTALRIAHECRAQASCTALMRMKFFYGKKNARQACSLDIGTCLKELG